MSDWEKALFDDPDLMGHFSWSIEAGGKMFDYVVKKVFKRMSKSNLK